MTPIFCSVVRGPKRIIVGLRRGKILKSFWTSLVKIFENRRVWLAMGSLLALSSILVISYLPIFHPGQTQITVYQGDGKQQFFTYEKNLGAALKAKRIALFPQDKTSLPLSTKLAGKPLNLTLEKSGQVLIMDGYTRITGRSTESDPAKILADNNIKIWPEDKVSYDLILDPVTFGTVGPVVKIERAPVYYVQVDGGQKEVRSWDPTVSVILNSSKVQINKIDEISPGGNEKLVPGTAVVVTRVNEEDATETSSVPFETQNTSSQGVAFGQTLVTQAGANGLLQKTYHIVYKDGVLVSKTLTSSAITQAAKPKIVTRGVKVGRANFGYYSGMTTSFYLGMTGRHLLVTNLANGKQVTVTIIGSGPFNGPLMDMGVAAFEAIGGSTGSGYIPSVSVALVD